MLPHVFRSRRAQPVQGLTEASDLRGARVVRRQCPQLRIRVVEQAGLHERDDGNEVRGGCLRAARFHLRQYIRARDRGPKAAAVSAPIRVAGPDVSESRPRGAGSVPRRAAATASRIAGSRRDRSPSVSVAATTGDGDATGGGSNGERRHRITAAAAMAAAAARAAKGRRRARACRARAIWVCKARRSSTSWRSTGSESMRSSKRARCSESRRSST